MCELLWFRMADNPKHTLQPPKRLFNEYLAVACKKKKRNESAWDNKLYEIEIVAINEKVKIRYKGYSKEADERRENADISTHEEKTLVK